MDWNRGYAAELYAAIVDRYTWRDREAIRISGGTVTRSDSELVESASVETSYHNETEQYIRIWMNVKQNGTADHVAIFTGMTSTPQREINGVVMAGTVECFSVLKPAEDILLARGWYTMGDRPGAEIVEELLSVIDAPIEMEENSPALLDVIIAEDGETNLSMAQKVAEAINWRIRIDGEGRVHIEPKPVEPIAVFDAFTNDSIEPELTMTNDWFECPNVFRAISEGTSAIARDEDDGSMFSVQNRGREIWMEETNVNLNEGEDIAGYSIRRLKEEQSCALTAQYSRRFHPDIRPGDIVNLQYPKQGLVGNFNVTDQSIELSAGARTEETVERSEGSY